jgi:hypothetical protein
MCKEGRVFHLHQVQPMGCRPWAEAILGLDPFDQPRLQHAPQTIAEVPIPVVPVVGDPAADLRVVSFCELFGAFLRRAVEPRP